MLYVRIISFTKNLLSFDAKFIVKKLGLKDYLPAYLDPYIREKDLPTGVCFASAGSGYDGVTSQIQVCMHAYI